MTSFFRYIPKPEARAAIISLGVSLALLVIKFLAYFHTGSSAILSDALEGIVNVLASGFAVFALSTAHRPADREHPYGHGKVEFLSAGFEGGMILLAAVLIIAGGLKQIFVIHGGGARIEEIAYGLLLLAVALTVNGVLGLYLVRTGKSRHSLTLEADGWHLLGDALTSGTAIISLLIVKFSGWLYADPLGAIVIAIYICWMGMALLRRAAAGLMDEQDLEDATLLAKILDAHVAGKEPWICSYHKLRHRHSGRYHWVDFHIVIPPTWDVRRGHEIASSIEYEIEQALGEGNATAHIEPCTDAACKACGQSSVVSGPLSVVKDITSDAPTTH